MTITQVQMPEGAIETLDDKVGFIALVDRMEIDHALKVVNSARISYDKKQKSFNHSTNPVLCIILSF